MYGVLKSDVQYVAIQLSVVFAGSERAKDICMKRQQFLEDWVTYAKYPFLQQAIFFFWARFSTAGRMRLASYSHRRRHGQGNFQVAATAAFLVARRGVEGSASGETQQRSRSAQSAAQSSAISPSLNHQSKTLTNQSIGRTFTDQTESRNSKIVRFLDVASASYRSFPP